MSVTVGDLMKLPSLRNSRVVAGRGGLGRIVTSVSVLEYGDPGNLLDSLYASNEFNGGEIVISGFINIRHDVEAQCFNIRRMAAVGEVGLILYYVGVLLPAIDRRLVTLCDELDFTLICMPEGRVNLRYSEVICEVMEAVFKDQQSDPQLVSALLDRVALLPEHQRSVDTVLKMLSDRIRASVVLTDQRRRVLNAVTWPRTLDYDLEGVIQRLSVLPEPGGPPLELHDPQALLYRCPVETPSAMELFLFKEGEPLSAEPVRQAGEVVRLAVNIWSQNHARMAVSELVRAILKDEPIKMRRLAQLFRVDVASIHTMWILRCLVQADREKLSDLLDPVRRAAESCARTVVADLYQDDLVLFLDGPDTVQEADALYRELRRVLDARALPAVLTQCEALADTAQVRSAFLTNQGFLSDAMTIFPGRLRYTLSEVAFARSCHETISQGETALRGALACLAPLEDARDGGELLRTLSVYLLDAQSSVSRTAQSLFLHKNTVKYRIQKLSDLLGCRVDRMPEALYFYQAAALRRLMS